MQNADSQLYSKRKFTYKQLFLLDGFGALLSTFLLGVVLVRFESVFGIPKSTLYLLAFWPILFAIYDSYCYFLIKEKLGSYLKGIAFANLAYCIFSIVVAFIHKEAITLLGWAYIVIEIIIVLIITKFEFKAVKSENRNIH